MCLSGALKTNRSRTPVWEQQKKCSALKCRAVEQTNSYGLLFYKFAQALVESTTKAGE